jgi:hypothetical protein
MEAVDSMASETWFGYFKERQHMSSRKSDPTELKRITAVNKEELIPYFDRLGAQFTKWNIIEARQKYTLDETGAYIS